MAIGPVDSISTITLPFSVAETFKFLIEILLSLWVQLDVVAKADAKF